MSESIGIPEKYIMKLSGSVVEYGMDYRYDRKIKEKIFDGQNGSVVPLCYNHIHEIGSLAGVAELKTTEKGMSADCYIYDIAYGRSITEFINANLIFELGIYANNIETTTHGDETIITKGTIREISIIPVENVRYPVKIEGGNI